MKKIKNILIITCIFSLIFANSVFASDEIEDLNLFGLVEKENNTINILDYKLSNMRIDVTSADRSAKSMENTIENLRDLGFSARGSSLEGMLYVVEVVPAQVKYGLFSLDNNRDVTVNSLDTGIRQMIMGLISYENAYAIGQAKNEFYNKEYENAKLSYELGKLSQSDLLKSEIELLESEVSLKNTERDIEDSSYALNNLIGFELNKTYNVKRETQFDMELKDASIYVESALSNRLEIKDVQERMLLEVIKRQHYDFRNFLDILDIRTKYTDAAREILLLTNELELTKQTITEEIYSAVNEISILDLQISQLESTLEMQQNNFKTLIAQYNQGNLPESATKALEFAIMDIEGNLEVLRYSYNTKRYQLYNATLLGPAYGGGM